MVPRICLSLLQGLSYRQLDLGMEFKVTYRTSENMWTHLLIQGFFFFIFTIRNAFQLTGVPYEKFICGISFLLNAFEAISCVLTW
jgi:hypothetical protein